MSEFMSYIPPEELDIEKNKSGHLPEEKETRELLDKAVDLVGKRALIKVLDQVKVCLVGSVSFSEKKVRVRIEKGQGKETGEVDSGEEIEIGINNFFKMQKECKLLDPEKYQMVREVNELPPVVKGLKVSSSSGMSDTRRTGPIRLHTNDLSSRDTIDIGMLDDAA